MALFGKVDDDLPYLTRFYQVKASDYNNPDPHQEMEMIEFLKREHDKAEIPGQEKQDDSSFWLPDLDTLPAYWDLHAIVRHLMDALADNGTVSGDDLDRLTKFFDDEEVTSSGDVCVNQFVVRSATLPPGIGHTPESGGLYPIRDLIYMRWLPDHEPEPVLKAVLSEIRALFGKNPPTVLRCEDCNNPFIVLRRGQKYCSHRCSDRVSKRRRRSLSV